MEQILQLENRRDKNTTITIFLKLEEEQAYAEILVKGELDKFDFDDPQELERKNELWKGTCFELFLANKKSSEYIELNLTPSLAWNLYHFEDIHKGMSEISVEDKPFIESSKIGNRYRLRYRLNLENFTINEETLFNATAILLRRDNERTFWSALDLREKPDFHDKAYFLEML